MLELFEGEGMEERPSFIVTGASASGKTTLVREAQGIGYEYLPTHTTREKRIGERDGIDNIFVSRDEFEDNFRYGRYLEPSLDYAELKSIGVYYGTPAAWIEELGRSDRCAAPVAIRMARKVLSQVNAIWVYLVCNDSDRYERLACRGYSEEEIIARMVSGESAGKPPEEAIVFNTSNIKPDKILHKLRSRDERFI